MAQDDELASFDQNYIRSAGHNCNHFRNPENKESVDWVNESMVSYEYTVSKKFSWWKFWKDKKERIRLKPKLVASAWYAQLHAAALELAGSNEESDKAAAWLFETFALHFLQDGVSAGHILAPTEGGTSTKTKEVHDKYSYVGLDVSIENICAYISDGSFQDKLNISSVVESCSSEPRHVKVFGDENLKDSQVTEELGVLLSYLSLKEFGRAMNSKPLMDKAELISPLTDDPAWAFEWSEGKDRELYKSMFRWWESAGQEKLENSPMAVAAKLHFEAGNMKALELWPTSVEN